MDSLEATKLVFSRIKAIDPENASKIMGYLLIQDNGDKEMIRLAFGPETLLHSLVFKAKTHLSNSSASATSPSSLSPCSAPWLPARSPTNASRSYARVVSGTNTAAGSKYYSNISKFDEFHHQLRDHLSFIDESELAMSSTDDGCKLHHTHSPNSAAVVGSSRSKLNDFEQCQELLRSNSSKAKLAAASQFVGSFPYNKCMNFLNDTQRSAALMMGDELHKFGNFRPERNEFLGYMNPSARQIYLTFPADSAFREEDVSNYFSIYGPVHDVRIPYQQKRMFGFVSFVYPETVKLILAKGNPHFVCDSRVLVKPYKEKGKIQEKKQQQTERGEYSSACSSPSGPFDFHFGGRMLYNNQEMLQRKLQEQADLQQAIEMQGRRLMNLQLPLNNNLHNHRFHHGFSNGSPIPSPAFSHTPNNQTRISPPDGTNEEVRPEENGGNPVTDSQNADHQLQQEGSSTSNHNNNGNSIGNNKEESTNSKENDLHNSLDHILPDNLFASPEKSASGHITVFSSASTEVDVRNTRSTTFTNSSTKFPSTFPLNMASLESFLLQMSRFSSGHGTIGM